MKAKRLSEEDPPLNVKLRDTHQLIYLVTQLWEEVFSKEFSLTREVRQWMFEVRTIRNQWAHQEDFNLRETYRALDTIERCLEAIPAKEATMEVRKLREYILFKMANKIKERNRTEEQENKQDRQPIVHHPVMQQLQHPIMYQQPSIVQQQQQQQQLPIMQHHHHQQTTTTTLHDFQQQQPPRLQYQNLYLDDHDSMMDMD